MKRTILVLVLVIAALSIPSYVFSGSMSLTVTGGHGSITVGQNYHTTRYVTTIRRGDRYCYHHHNYRRHNKRFHHKTYRRNPYNYVHRQEGRVYYETGRGGRRVIVVPSDRQYNYRY